MKNKILLIDGNSILNRAFYGFPFLTNKDGLSVNGVYGFMNIMMKHVYDWKPTHIAVSFDVKAPTFRHEIYPSYKGTRGPKPAGFSDNFPLLQNLLDFCHIPWYGIPGYEGDDILGSLSCFFAKEPETEITILSGDKDLFQLIQENVTIRFPKNGGQVTVYDIEKFQEEYGIKPRQFIDVKALMGDSSDNIIGIKGIGPKTAEKLIQEYGSIDNLYSHISTVRPLKIRNLLNGNFHQVTFNRKLVTIRTDIIPINCKLEDLKITDLFPEEAYNYAKEIGIKDHLFFLS